MLTAGLLARGWRYFCDEFAVIDAKTRELHPYPRAICIKQAGFGVIRSLGLSIHAGRQYVKGSKGWVGFVNPRSVRPDFMGRPCPIRYVIFPKYTRSAEPALIPVTRGEAAFEVHRLCFNLLGCEALGIDVIADTIRNARCYRLISGELNRTCDLVERLVAGDAVASAWSA